MKRKNKNKFWSVLLGCFCSVAIVLALLGAITWVSGVDIESSPDFPYTDETVGDVDESVKTVTSLCVESGERIVYNDNSVQNYNQKLPERIVFFGAKCGAVKYLIDTNLGIDVVKYSDLSASIEFSDYVVGREQSELGFKAGDFLDVYFDFGYVTFVALRYDLSTSFDVRISYVPDPSVFVDVEVVFWNGRIYDFDGDTMESVSRDHSAFWEDIQSALSRTVCGAASSEWDLYNWSSESRLQSRVEQGSVCEDFSDSIFQGCTSEARYCELVMTDITLSDDCILTAPRNVGGSYDEWLEVINMPTILFTGDPCSVDWGESYTGIVISCYFSYIAEKSELHLFIIVDSEYDNVSVWYPITLSDGTYRYDYQQKVLDHFNFAQSPGYGGDSAYSGAQGSIGWHGGDYYVFVD